MYPLYPFYILLPDYLKEKWLSIDKQNELCEDYYKWIKETNQKDLTNNQVYIANFLLINKKELQKVGNFEKVFKSIMNYI